MVLGLAVVLESHKALLIRCLVVWLQRHRVFAVFGNQRSDQSSEVPKLSELFIGLFDFVVLLSISLLLLIRELFILRRNKRLLRLVVVNFAHGVEDVSDDLFVQAHLRLIGTQKEFQSVLANVCAAIEAVGSLQCLHIVVFFCHLTLGEQLTTEFNVTDLLREALEEDLFHEL